MEKTDNKPLHISFTVINDLTCDQRMQRIGGSLAANGFRITLIGRQLPDSPPLSAHWPFAQKRLRVWFQKGKLFYITYNLQLFWHLLTTPYDIYGATDLDTLLPNYWAAKLKNKPFTYDAHEYFAELPEIVHRPWVRRIWKAIEQYIVPRTKYAYTINQTYADLFKKEYGTEFAIVRNATILRPLEIPAQKKERYILYQGAVNVGRGIEEMIQAMPYIEDDLKLYICGIGDVYDNCVALVQQLGLSDKVKFWGRIAPEQLRQFTLQATLGFTFFTQQGLSYYYSLANRFFDYFHCGVPQLCMNYPEYKHINNLFEVAVLLDNLDPQNIAQSVNDLLKNPEKYTLLQENCLKARQSINWQNEELKLVSIYQNLA